MSSTSITFFNEHGCRSSLLPAIENADHDIVLYEKWFWLEEDVKVLLECVKGQWILKSNNPCRIYQWMRGRLMPVEGNYALQDGDAIMWEYTCVGLGTDIGGQAW